MANGDANKRARPQADVVVVKQERVETRESQGGKGKGALVAAEAPVPVPWSGAVVVEMNMFFYHCFVCKLPLRPPVHKCEGGHFVCGTCHGDFCTACHPPTAYRPSPSRDDAIHALQIPCRFAADGCGRKLVYYEFDDHLLQCAIKPTHCPEHGCSFWAGAPALAEHVSSAHSWPLIEVQYGHASILSVPPTWRGRHLLVEKDERRLFVLTLSASGEDTAVSLLCVRESSPPPGELAALPRFRSQVWADVRSDKEFHLFQRSIMASSNHLTGGQQPNSLKVPPGFGNDGEDIILTFRIDVM